VQLRFLVNARGIIVKAFRRELDARLLIYLPKIFFWFVVVKHICVAETIVLDALTFIKNIETNGVRLCEFLSINRGFLVVVRRRLRYTAQVAFRAKMMHLQAECPFPGTE